MKICEGYATLQNNITKKETLWKIKVCIWEIPVPPGRKAAGFEWEMEGNKIPNASVQPHEVSGKEGTVAREGDTVGSWDMEEITGFASAWAFILSPLQLKLLNHCFLNKLGLESRLEISPARVKRERVLSKRSPAMVSLASEDNNLCQQQAQQPGCEERLEPETLLECLRA